MKIPTTLALASFALASVSTAQGITPSPVAGTPTPLSYDVATGTFSAGVASLDTNVITYSNTCTSGFYSVPTFGSEWLDWGVKTGGATGWSDTMTWGYATLALDPGIGGLGAAYWVTASFGATGFGNPGIKAFATPVTGGAGSLDGITPAGYTVTFNNCANMVFLPDGPIGYSFTNCDSLSGPLLIAVPCAPGTVDAIDIYVAPATMGGTYIATTAFTTPGIASIYFEMTEDDGATPATAAVVRNGTVPNPVTFAETSTAQWGSTWDTTVVVPPGSIASAIGISVPLGLDIFIPGLGSVLIDITPPNPLIIDIGFGAHSIPIPPDCSLDGLPWESQAATVGAGGGLTLTNALDFTTGA